MHKHIIAIIITFFISVFQSNAQSALRINKAKQLLPEDFHEKYIVIPEKEVGMYLSYKNFKNGIIEEASDKEKSTLMTTMLLGSSTFLYEYIKTNMQQFIIEVIKPNDFFSSTFVLKYKLDIGEIFIIRMMNRNEFSYLNPFAAEDPKNYFTLIGLNLDDENKEDLFINLLQNYCESKDINVLN